MQDYVIFTDSGCDVSPELLEQWGVPYVSMTFLFDGEEKEYTSSEMDLEQFYQRMREGGHAKTAAVNTAMFVQALEPLLQQGKDVLYVAFSSGLSTTVQSARMAIEQLAEQYPQNRVVMVDTLAASAGEGLMVYMAVQKKAQGASLDETAAYIKGLEDKHCIWFTVDDLTYLKRGGRVSPTVAFVGGLLGIKPVLKMDGEGHLIKHSTARGRTKAIEALADKYGELADNDGSPIFISHAQCYDEAKQLADLIKARYGGEVTLITDIGPIIGAHAGPGTIALFFIGAHR